MSKYSLTQMEVLAVLLNDGCIVWTCSPGNSSYKAFVPSDSCTCRFGKYVGYLGAVTMQKLFNGGFLNEVSRVNDEFGAFVCIFKFCKPNLPFFSLDKNLTSTEEVSGNE